MPRRMRQRRFSSDSSSSSSDDCEHHRKFFRIVSEMNHKAVEIHGDICEGAKIVMNDRGDHGKNQLWYVGDDHFIKSAARGMVFAGHGEGSELHLSKRHGDGAYKWRIEGKRIVNGHGHVLDIKGAKHHDGAELCAYHYKGGSNQHWDIHYV